VLGPLDQIPDGKARSFVVELKDGRCFGFVVRRGHAVFGYIDQCAHLGLPLAQALDQYLTPDGRLIQCSWHGALYKVDSGRCVGGPCVGQALRPWPVTVRDGQIVTLGPAG
jgi:nitrite reductase/ring-hydroxylating ferredoxin subunit